MEEDGGATPPVTESRSFAGCHAGFPWHPDGSVRTPSGFAERLIRGYAHRVVRRVICAITLLALASTPVVARTRLFCRYTGVEITDCAEQDVPGRPVVQAEGCCHGQVTRPLSALLGNPQAEIAPPTLHALPGTSAVASVQISPPVPRKQTLAAPTGPPLLLITRALLI